MLIKGTPTRNLPNLNRIGRPYTNTVFFRSNKISGYHILLDTDTERSLA